jgi:enoyl-CoA hydratase/carnithine racemase
VVTDSRCFRIEHHASVFLLRLESADATNRLTIDCIGALTEELRGLSAEKQALIIAGNARFFSAGADLNEIATLTGPDAYEFSRLGQQWMQLLDDFPAPVFAAISGYCMGGGLDLALACHDRIAAPDAVFGHRGASLGLITGWGGTQRLPRLIGKGRALQMLTSAETISASEALRIGLVDAIAEDPVAEALKRAER